MMKQQQSDIKKKPSRVCKFLLLLVVFKLCLLSVILLEPLLEYDNWLLSVRNLARESDTSQFENAEEKVIMADFTKIDLQGPNQVENTDNEVSLISSGVAYAATPTAAPTSTQPDPAAATSGQTEDSKMRATMDALTRKQEELNRKEQDLRTLEADLNKRFEDMQALEGRLQIMLKDASDLKDAKYKHLVDMLSNMKARQAATLLETLDEKIAVRVLSGMRGRDAGEVLTYVTPEKAARLTEALARMQLPLE